MNLKDLPKEIEEIILYYKSQLEYSERYDKLVKDIKNNLKIEYLVPIWDSDMGYIAKTIKYKEENFKRLNTILCFCCGRDISLTHDEYEEINEEEIDYQLHYLYSSIMRDIRRKRYEVLEDISEMGYNEMKGRITDRLEQFVIGTTEHDDNEYRILVDYDTEGEIEEILESDEEVVELTPEELLEMMEEIGFEENMYDNMDNID